MYDIIELNNKLVGELKEIAKSLNLPKYEALKKQELIYKILDHQAINPPPATTQKNTETSTEEHKTLRPRNVRLDNIDTESKTIETASPSFFHDEEFTSGNHKPEQVIVNKEITPE
ncbi:MAG: Rho termination factor N-terminal domain-containing protein, partial [Bacteroidetes bacterium]|nr:Rho termination factor N-terminal domain-containing protein [Bacteroidota bacterium]